MAFDFILVLSYLNPLAFNFRPSNMIKDQCNKHTDLDNVCNYYLHVI